MRRLARAQAISCQETSVWPFRGLCFFQTWACSSGRGRRDRAQLALVRHAAERHHVEHRRGQVGQQLEAADGRGGNASASAIACSFQPWASSRSIARQMSTLDIEARIRFSATERIASAASSASHTMTSISASPALIAAFTRRLPTTIISRPSFGGDAGRLDDADRLDRGDQLLVHGRRHRRAAGVVRVELEGAGIDAA